MPNFAALGEVIGGYRLTHLLAAGGMGEVYVAEHALLGRRAAVKVLSPELSLDARYVERFLREARIVNAVRHPNIVDIFDFVEVAEPRRVACIMELLDGVTVREALRRRRGPFEPAAAVGLVLQLLDALAAVHAAGVVHRDLKPENLMLVGEPPRLKILDFGIARVSASPRAITRVGARLGTPAYMAPEQIETHDISGAADVYAVGEILFELLTGRRLFAGGPDEVVERKARGETPPLELVGPAAAFAPVLTRALDPVPARRPSLGELRAACVGSIAEGTRSGAGEPRAVEGPSSWPPAGRAAPDPLAPTVVDDRGHGEARAHEEARAVEGSTSWPASGARATRDPLAPTDVEPRARGEARAEAPPEPSRGREDLRGPPDPLPSPGAHVAIVGRPSRPPPARTGPPLDAARPAPATGPSPPVPPVRRTRRWGAAALLGAVGLTALVVSLRGPRVAPPAASEPHPLAAELAALRGRGPAEPPPPLAALASELDLDRAADHRRLRAALERHLAAAPDDPAALGLYAEARADDELDPPTEAERDRLAAAVTRAAAAGPSPALARAGAALGEDPRRSAPPASASDPRTELAALERGATPDSASVALLAARSPRARRRLAILLAERGEPARARALLAPRLRSEPDEPLLRLAQARIEAAAGELDRAIHSAGAVAGDPHAGPAARLLQGALVGLRPADLELSSSLYSALAGDAGAPAALRAAAAARLGERALSARRLEDARRWSELALAADPRHGLARRVLAAGRLAAGLPLAAEDRADLAADPDPIVATLAAIDRLAAGEHPAAEAALARAEAALPDDLLLPVLLAVSRASLGDERGARAALDRAASLDPLELERGGAIAAVATGVLAARLAEAKERTNGVLERSLAGALAFRDGRRVDAEAALADAVGRPGAPALAVVLLGAILAERGARHDASALLRRFPRVRERVGGAVVEALLGVPGARDRALAERPRLLRLRLERALAGGRADPSLALDLAILPLGDPRRVALARRSTR